VTAANSGNDAPTIDRREPLALLAAHNTMKQYPVDPQQVYIGGFSGGARVALRLALAYPDVFHGALLNAGSDRYSTHPFHLSLAKLGLHGAQQGTDLWTGKTVELKDNMPIELPSHDILLVRIASPK